MTSTPSKCCSFLPHPGVVPHGGPGGGRALLGRLGELVGRHAHVVQDVGQLPRVDPAVVGHVLLASLVHVRQARCRQIVTLDISGWTRGFVESCGIDVSVREGQNDLAT